MAETDWKEVVDFIRTSLQDQQQKLIKEADNIAAEIGRKIADNRDADVQNLIIRLKCLDAHISGVRESMQLTTGFLTDAYVLPAKRE